MIDASILILAKNHEENVASSLTLNDDPILPNICIGYFDYLYITRLSTTNLDLWTINEHAARELKHLSFQPTFLFYDTEDEAEKINRLKYWKKKSLYRLVTFVHSNYSLPTKRADGVELPIKKLQRVIRNTLKKNGFTENEHYIIYMGVELSNIIIIWSSDKLRQAVDTLRELNGKDGIGLLQTSISFSNEIDLFDVEVEVLHRIRFCIIPRGSDDIARFHRLCKEHIKEESIYGPFLGVGSDEIYYEFHEIESDQLLSLIRDVSSNKNTMSVHTTYLGEKIDTEFGKRKKRDKCIQEICYDISNTYNSISSKISHYAWYKPMHELIKQTSRICHDYALDEVCYIALSSLHLFTSQLKQLVERNSRMGRESITSQEQSAIINYTEGLHLIYDQALKTEGPFLQEPGYNPVVFDIPARLLEFYTAFIAEFASVLNEKDENNYIYPTLTVPKICFRVRNCIVFESLPPTDRLLQIDIPVHLIYDTRKVMQMLGHEICHFSGDNVRKRKERLRTYIMTVSLFVAVFFEVAESTKIIDMIYRILIAEYHSESTKLNISDEQQNYISYMTKITKTIVGRIIAKRNEIYTEFNETHLNKPRAEAMKQTLKQENELLVRVVNKQFYDKVKLFIDDISCHLQECLADVLSITLLKVTLEEYIDSMESELVIAEEAAKAHIIQRLAIVIEVISPNEYLKLKTGNHYISDLAQYIRGDKKHSEWYHPIQLLGEIVKYIKECKKYLEETISSNKEQCKSIAEYYSEVGRNYRLCSDIFYKALHKNRLEIRKLAPKAKKVNKKTK